MSIVNNPTSTIRSLRQALHAALAPLGWASDHARTHGRIWFELTEAGYRLGRRLVELGGAYLASVDQVQEFYAACRRAPTISGLTARVAVLEGLDVLYLARYDGTLPIRLTANIGDRFPANCTATGKVRRTELAGR